MNDIDYIIPILKKYHTAFTNESETLLYSPRLPFVLMARTY